MDLTIIQQGTFVSNGKNITIPLESGVDWMKVYNYSIASANQVAATAVSFYWQRGFPANSAWVHYKSNAANAANLDAIVTTGGFTYVDTSAFGPGVIYSADSLPNPLDITGISNAAIPVVTVANNFPTLPAGSVVRMFDVTGALQLCGMDFTVGLNTLTANTFSLDYCPQVAAAAGADGAWTVISYGPSYWYPPYRYITNITNAAQAVVTLSVTHNYQVGQSVRFQVRSAYGMTEIDGLLGDIVAVNAAANTITVDINTTGFSAFTFPVTADVPFTFAQVVPVGEDTALALQQGVNILSDATVNTAITGMQLTGGAGYPGGANNNVMYWVAGKSFNQ